MNWSEEIMLVPRLIVATGLGAFIGFERQRRGNTAGIRTRYGGPRFLSVRVNIRSPVFTCRHTDYF